MKQEPVPRFVVRGHSTRCQALGTPTDPIRSTRKAHHPNPPSLHRFIFQFYGSTTTTSLRLVGWWEARRQGWRSNCRNVAKQSIWAPHKLKPGSNFEENQTKRFLHVQHDELFSLSTCRLLRRQWATCKLKTVAEKCKNWRRSLTDGVGLRLEWVVREDWGGGGGGRQAARKYSKLYQNLNFRFHYAAAACALLIDQLPLCFFIFFLPWLKSLLRQQGISLFNFDRRVFIQVMSCICGQEN